MPKVSIIVPVFNVEDYIKKCLETLRDQTFNDYEVIVINDGSQDSSGKIAEEFCEAEENFYYYEHENRGLGLTRNRGIELSKGEYIGFVDSDDTIPATTIEKLYQKAKESDFDIVCGETIFVYPDETSTKKDTFKEVRDLTIDSNYEEFFKEYYFTGIYSHNAWDKLYKNKLVKENKIQFGDNKVVFGEDNFFQLQILQHVKQIGFIEEPVYYYYQREDSIMNSPKKDVGKRQLNMLKLLNEKNTNETFERAFSLLAFDAIVMEVLNVVNTESGSEIFYKQMEELRQDDFFVKNIRAITDLKSYQLITRSDRRNFIRVVSMFERKKAYGLSNRLIYALYSRR